MAELRIEVPTAKTSMAEVRPELEAALADLLPADFIEHRWQGDVLHLSGAGARGTVVLEAGRLIGQADLRPPASLLRSLIEQKVAEALARAAR